MSAVPSRVLKERLPAANSSQDASDEIQSRNSRELVIGLSGAVGSGIGHVRGVLESALIAHGYDVVPIKISEKFRGLARDLGVDDPTVDVQNEYERIWHFQDLGNALREQLGDDLAAQIALSQIAHDRVDRHPDVEIDEIVPRRVAYLVDQLKNPREAMLLRRVYGNLFYLVGILSGYDRRRSNLIGSPMGSAEAETLIERDRAEADGGGQQLEKTLKLADFFVRNAHDNVQELRMPLERFIGLIHGKNGITPTVVERGMYAAYSASLRSACLSRQVGASIVDSDGTILATGCNDVPKAGGGLYEAGAGDQRCVFRDGGVCFNDKYKDKLRGEIEQLLIENDVERGRAGILAAKIRSGTRLRDLIEFSRAVHAEMDALISAARKGGVGVQGGTLFTTTYPCHNCARHIVAAGIESVYFIEPYGKSLASELHGDSITHEFSVQRPLFHDRRIEKVQFVHFEGVAPRRFSDLFSALDSRKDAGGKARGFVPSSAEQVAPELLDNYRQLEAKVVERMRNRLLSATDPSGDSPG